MAAPHLQVVLTCQVINMPPADHSIAKEVGAEGAEVAVNAEGVVQGPLEGVHGPGVGGVAHQVGSGVWPGQGRGHVDEPAPDAVGAGPTFGKCAADLQEAKATSAMLLTQSSALEWCTSMQSIRSTS